MCSASGITWHFPTAHIEQVLQFRNPRVLPGIVGMIGPHWDMEALEENKSVQKCSSHLRPELIDGMG